MIPDYNTLATIGYLVYMLFLVSAFLVGSWALCKAVLWVVLHFPSKD